MSNTLGRLFWYFSARGRKVHFSTVGGLHGGSLPRPKLTFPHTGICQYASPRRARQGQRTYFPKTPSADVRRVHFSTVGGLHGVRLSRLKNLFFKNRFPPTFGEYTSPPSVASTARARQGQRTIYKKSGFRRAYRRKPQKTF